MTRSQYDERGIGLVRICSPVTLQHFENQVVSPYQVAGLTANIAVYQKVVQSRDGTFLNVAKDVFVGNVGSAINVTKLKSLVSGISWNLVALKSETDPPFKF